MQAKDLMSTEVFSVREEDRLDDLMERLIHEHIHGAPVLDATGKLVGVVSQQDVFFSAMTLAGKRPPSKTESGKPPLVVKDIMTAPAVSATEETEVGKLCGMMKQLRIHRVPIVRDGRVIGIVSSLDICNAVARGDLKE